MPRCILSIWQLLGLKSEKNLPFMSSKNFLLVRVCYNPPCASALPRENPEPSRDQQDS